MIIKLFMADNIDIGKEGEEMAAKYLVDKGYKLLCRNWKYVKLEIDIIASRDGIIHFIEVKTRNHTFLGYPEEDVTKRKMANLIDAAEEYLYRHPGWSRIQFDIISIMLLKNRPPEFYMLEDVYI